MLRDTGRRNLTKLEVAAQEHFGLPDDPLVHWKRIAQPPALARARERRTLPPALVSGDR